MWVGMMRNRKLCFKSFYLPSGPLLETDKAIEVAIGYRNTSKIRAKIWIPKSQINIRNRGRLIEIPEWLVAEKVPSDQTILEI